MKRFAVLFLLLLTVAVMHAQSSNNTTQKQLRHVVLFRFKDGTSPQDIQKVEEAFRALPSKIKEIKGFEWGINNSPEKLNEGLTHCFFLTFDSEKGRDIYLPHPAHKAFGAILKPYLDKVVVVDYWVNK
ncbi:Dabb family protein [Flavisolibacter nicotianae]|uniref:Dabb family protein n=1 Tax=Flavisolibacter nicotianae TaxID=2364882 RepID=UPI000EAEF3F4|nr:Dabb family protein [Flavisolibacter nicotianae]